MCQEMAIPQPHAHLCSSDIDLVLVVTLALNLMMGGQVTGLPFLGGSFNSSSRRTHFETMANDMSGRVEHLTAQLKAQEAQITDLGTQLAKVMQSMSFTVTFSDRDIADLGENQTLKFDRVRFNAGEGYSPRTGLFTAPADGLYSLSLQVSRHPLDPSSCIEVDLVHSFTREEGPQPPSEHSGQQQQQQQQKSLSAPQSHDHQQQQQKSLSAPQSHDHHQQQQQEKITSVLTCVQDEGKTSASRAVVRLLQGHTVHAQMRSGTMLLGDVFTSMSGLKLPVLSPLFRPLLH